MSASNWNLNLTVEQITEIKRYFDQWQEIQERKKELAAENKNICIDAAKVFDGKQTDASKYLLISVICSTVKFKFQLLADIIYSPVYLVH